MTVSKYSRKNYLPSSTTQSVKRLSKPPVGVWIDPDYTCQLLSEARHFATKNKLPLVPDREAASLLIAFNQRGVYLFFGEADKAYLQLNFNQFNLKLSVRDPLIKAMGRRQMQLENKSQRSTVLDLTAGWAEDAIHLVHAGFTVTSLERHPTVYALLEETRQRSNNEMVQDYFQLIHANSMSYLHSLNEEVDTIYYDPMFPEKRRKSAAVGKQMRFMQALVGGPNPEEESHLLALARTRVKYRVVVKRPLKSRPLNGPAPSGNIKGKLVRFDIYPPSVNNRKHRI